MKIVCMIPARLGSQRVKNKNLRNLGDRPLISHIIATAKEVKHFDEIYINSESESFKNIAYKSNILFYKRKKILASNKALNDDFTLDFLNNVDCDFIIQLLPTAPFLKSTTIEKFINQMIKNKLDTLISTKNVRIECIYKNKPINFDLNKKTPPSQDLEPIKAYACGVMGWKKNKFIQNMNKYNCAYHGPSGKTDFFDISDIESFDIDYESDFKIAESFISSALITPNKLNINGSTVIQSDVPKILKDDGVKHNILDDYNKEKLSIDEIIKKKPSNKSWSHRLINSKSNSATLIAQLEGEGNRMHYHPDWDEWWYILKGKWNWTVEGKQLLIKKGDIVFIERNRKHKITSIGKSLSIRLAVSRSDVEHIYEKEDIKKNKV